MRTINYNVVNISFDHFNLLAEKFPKLISQLMRTLMRRNYIVLTLLAQRIYNTEKSFRVSSTALNELRMIRGSRSIKKSRELVTHSFKGVLSHRSWVFNIFLSNFLRVVLRFFRQSLNHGSNISVLQSSLLTSMEHANEED